MAVHVFGVRHHGPGSARSVRDGLRALEPDVVLVEGPADADPVLALASHADMKPPVALMLYAEDAPARAAFYPFAVFSPEWQAITYALEKGISVRFMDLPQAHQLLPPEGEHDDEYEDLKEDEAFDPIGALAKAAGYSDRELWWEHQVEQRRDAVGLFDAITHAMAELRRGREPKSLREARREAYMRRTIRTAEREGRARIAVVCGAWHAPALVQKRTAKEDDALLKGLPKAKVTATWIPWTYSRLSYKSGYGAGIASPGWYAHLWQHEHDVSARWIARIAHLLRGAQLDASSASVIEAVRLAEALAALRELSAPGLVELTDAAYAVLCQGSSAPLALVRKELEIGEVLGDVPEEAPAVPLARDLSAKQKRFRLKPTTEHKLIDLDLRSENDRAKSRMLHQLAILGIAWGELDRQATGLGTFHEKWKLSWKPELALAVVEASVYGNTVEAAAAAKIVQRAAAGATLPALTALLDAALLAELPEATLHVLSRVQEEAAVSADVRHLMAALPPLARATRYGSVRETPTEHLAGVIEGLFARVTIGLLGACASLDDGAAKEMLAGLGEVDETLAILDRAELKDEWARTLQPIAIREAIHGLVRGAACRVLVDKGVLDAAELERLARLSLSPAVPPAQAAAWLEGLLRGSALRVLHHDALWRALDEWLLALAPDTFLEMLPLVRRAFAGFGVAERRAMADKVKTIARGEGAAAPRAKASVELDERRVRRVLPVLARVLGAKHDGT